MKHTYNVKPIVNIRNAYIRLVYPQSILLWINYTDNNEWFTIFFFENENNISVFDATDEGYILLEFQDDESAIEYCNNIPHDIYACVYSFGSAIHEN